MVSHILDRQIASKHLLLKNKRMKLDSNRMSLYYSDCQEEIYRPILRFDSGTCVLGMDAHFIVS